MSAENKTYNRVVNHVAVHVPDVEAAAKWYTLVFGFERLVSTGICCDRATQPDNPIFSSYDSTLQKVKIEFLSTGNGVGLELMQFIDPPMTESASFEKDYRRGGFFHIAVTDPDPEALCAKVVQEGGKKIGGSQRIPDPLFGDKVVQCNLYVEDPWGNGIELMSCSWEKLMANRW